MTSPDGSPLGITKTEAPTAAISWSRLWLAIAEEIDSRLPGRSNRYRMPVVIIPLAGDQAPIAVGFLAPASVTFNARIVAWTIAILDDGSGGIGAPLGFSVTLDIRRTTVLTHPIEDSLCGSVGITQTSMLSIPDLQDTSLWISRDLADGDMLWVYCTAVTGTPKKAQLILRLQDLDEHV